ncbi:hypothetical protein ACUN8C_11545 [Kushneria sp. Sum13]|uniref:hypothetical protein n=1 Tax=Kushneria sp. Sum13 TaxID=3459196 RepID=UPI00404577E6
MAYSNTTQSLSFSAGGELTFSLPDYINTLSLTTAFTRDRVNSGDTLLAGVQGASLEALDVSGNGRVEWNNSADDTTAVSRVDATALSGGLEYTASSALQETILLGGKGNGVDVLHFSGDASRYGNDGDAIDTISGFDATRDTLLVDDEVMQSFDTLDFNYAVVADGASSLEEALTLAGEQDSGDAIMPVIYDDQVWLYQDSGPAGLDENDFALMLEDMVGGLNSFSDRQGYISKMAPAPTGPLEDVAVAGMTSGTDGAADSFIFGTDGAWQDATITNFELGVDRIDLSQLKNSDGEPLDYDYVHMTAASELIVISDSGSHYVPLVGVPKYDPGSPTGELNYAMGPEDFLFA